MHRLSLSRLSLPLLVAALSVCNLAGCSDPVAKKPDPVPTAGKAGHDDHDHDHHHHHHAEKGPHGGALVALPGDAAHLEVVLDAETGKLTAYVLDGEAKEPVSVKHESLTIAFTLPKSEDKKDEIPEQSTITLTAVDAADDGTAKEFAGQSDDLKNAKEFDAALTAISVGGKEHKGISFNYPKGNEHDHHHH